MYAIIVVGRGFKTDCVEAYYSLHLIVQTLVVECAGQCQVCNRDRRLLKIRLILNTVYLFLCDFLCIYTVLVLARTYMNIEHC